MKIKNEVLKEIDIGAYNNLGYTEEAIDLTLKKVEELIEKDNIDLGKIDGMTISEILKLYKSKIKQKLRGGSQ